MHHHKCIQHVAFQSCAFLNSYVFAHCIYTYSETLHFVFLQLDPFLIQNAIYQASVHDSVAFSQLLITSSKIRIPFTLNFDLLGCCSVTLHHKLVECLATYIFFLKEMKKSLILRKNNRKLFEHAIPVNNYACTRTRGIPFYYCSTRACQV